MFILSSNNVRSLFFEDVSKWFDIKDIRYTSRITLAGKSHYNHTFDFVLPKSRASNKPERIIKLINDVKNDNIKSTIFSFLDTQENRPEENQAMVLINDLDKSENKIKEAKEALMKYGIESFLWSTKNEHVEAFM